VDRSSSPTTSTTETLAVDKGSSVTVSNPLAAPPGPLNHAVIDVQASSAASANGETTGIRPSVPR
jgi:hypothetical protein